MQLCEPGGVREITSAHDSNALERRPFVEIVKVQLPARGPRVPRMNVEISDKLHGWTFSQSMWANAVCCKSSSYTIDKLQTAISVSSLSPGRGDRAAWPNPKRSLEAALGSRFPSQDNVHRVGVL